MLHVSYVKYPVDIIEELYRQMALYIAWSHLWE